MSLPEHAPASKRAIWEAAQRLFAENGYARTSVREIASEAAVDPALVIRHIRVTLDDALIASDRLIGFDVIDSDVGKLAIELDDGR